MAEEIRFRCRPPWWFWARHLVAVACATASSSYGPWRVGGGWEILREPALWLFWLVGGGLLFLVLGDGSLGLHGTVLVGKEGVALDWWASRSWLAWYDITAVDVVTRRKGKEVPPEIRVGGVRGNLRIGGWVENADGLLAEILTRKGLAEAEARPWGTRYGKLWGMRSEKELSRPLKV